MKTTSHSTLEIGREIDILNDPLKAVLFVLSLIGQCLTGAEIYLRDSPLSALTKMFTKLGTGEPQIRCQNARNRILLNFQKNSRLISPRALVREGRETSVCSQPRIRNE